MGLELSELDLTFRDAPHARLDDLRARAPRYLDPGSDGRRLFLTRHGDVRSALIDKGLTRDAYASPPRGADPAADTLLSMEGAKHRMGRKLVGGALDARAVEARRVKAAAIVDALLDDVEAQGRFDGVADFAARIPLLMITDLMGIAGADIAKLRVWAEDAGVLAMAPQRTPQEEARLIEANRGLRGIIVETLSHQRAAPSDGLIARLVAVDIDGARLRDEDIIPLCLLLLVAGSLTTTDVIGNGVALLLRRPDQLKLLRERPELIDAAVEEILRFDPPVSAVARHMPEAGEYLGEGLPQGGTVKASLIAANRDPEVFPDPHEFRIDRGRCDHVAFGGGAHACPGAALARMQAAVALSRLFARFPSLKIDGETPRKTAYGFRGYGALPLAIS
jgi:hypothetical protein